MELLALAKVSVLISRIVGMENAGTLLELPV